MGESKGWKIGRRTETENERRRPGENCRRCQSPLGQGEGCGAKVALTRGSKFSRAIVNGEH